MPFFPVSLSLPAAQPRGDSTSTGESTGGGHCGPDLGRERLTTVEFNNSPLNTREEEARFGEYEAVSWKGRGVGVGGGSSRASTGATAELSGGKQQACVYWFFCNPRATHSHLSDL